jgi:hypothetical protein
METLMMEMAEIQNEKQRKNIIVLMEPQVHLILVLNVQMDYLLIMIKQHVNQNAEMEGNTKMKNVMMRIRRMEMVALMNV